jgi:ribonuclease/clavin/mitogillin
MAAGVTRASASRDRRAATPATPAVNVGYRSTNYYVVGEGDRRLLVDIGWPGTFPALLAVMQRKDVRLEDVRYALATHFHVDHAGLAQDLKNRGVRLIVFPHQVAAIPVMAKYMKPTDHYLPITLSDNVTLTLEESRAFLRELGIAGSVVSTPGHSDDSVTLVLDEGVAFTGDLTVPRMAGDADREVVLRSWSALAALGVDRVYPGHGPAPRPFPSLDQPA